MKKHESPLSSYFQTFLRTESIKQPYNPIEIENLNSNEIKHLATKLVFRLGSPHFKDLIKYQPDLITIFNTQEAREVILDRLQPENYSDTSYKDSLEIILKHNPDFIKVLRAPEVEEIFLKCIDIMSTPSSKGCNPYLVKLLLEKNPEFIGYYKDSAIKAYLSTQLSYASKGSSYKDTLEFLLQKHNEACTLDKAHDSNANEPATILHLSTTDDIDSIGEIDLSGNHTG